MRGRHTRPGDRRSGGGPSDGPGITDPSGDDLAEVQARIDKLEARDLAAKYSGDHSERPEIGRMIYDLMRALRAARGDQRG